MNILYLVCSTDVPEVAKYTMSECVEHLPYKFDDYCEDDAQDEQIVRRIIGALSALPLGHYTDVVPNCKIWKVLDQ